MLVLTFPKDLRKLIKIAATFLVQYLGSVAIYSAEVWLESLLKKCKIFTKLGSRPIVPKNLPGHCSVFCSDRPGSCGNPKPCQCPGRTGI
jgi:hypothetical protein